MSLASSNGLTSWACAKEPERRRFRQLARQRATLNRIAAGRPEPNNPKARSAEGLEDPTSSYCEGLNLSLASSSRGATTKTGFVFICNTSADFGRPTVTKHTGSR